MKVKVTFIFVCLSIVLLTFININTIQRENYKFLLQLNTLHKAFAEGESGTPCYIEVQDGWYIGECYVLAQDCWAGSELTSCVVYEYMYCPPDWWPVGDYHEVFCEE
jgi:hypothetical protein